MKIFLLIFLFSLSSFGYGKECHYEYSVWNRPLAKAIKQVKIQKKYSELTKNEVDSSGCSPCMEDQVEIKLINGLKLKLCYKIANKVKKVLNQSLKSGFKIISVKGYNAQMSKGALDRNGNRTQLSNHSFGTAFDINREYNGLYDHCPVWSPQRCRLLQGGHYNKKNTLSLKIDSFIVEELNKLDIKWGGVIKGRQKDFMHFSLTGY